MPTPRRTPRRTAATAASALALAAVVLSGPPATAAPYEITTCGFTGAAGDWRPFGTPAAAGQLDVGADCPPRSPAAGEDPNWSPYRTGLYVTDTRRTAADTLPGASAGWQLEAPAGARITRAQVWRAVRKQDDRGWRAFWRAGTPDAPEVPDLDDCTIAIGTTACGVGEWGWSNESYVDRAGLDTQHLSFGIRCAAAAGERCLNGYGLHTARVVLFESRLTLDDPTAPTGVNGAGEGWTTTSWAQGTVPISVTGGDAQSGIRATRVYVDEAAVSTIDRSSTSACDWSRTTPCTPASAIAHTIDTTLLEDGVHDVDVAAVNAAGAVTRASRPAPLQVDNTPPDAPTGIVAGRRGSSNVFDITWSPVGDAGSPPAEARFQLCAPSCSPVQRAPSLTAIDALALPGTTDATLRVWIVDEAGHEDASRPATLPLTYLSPPPIEEPRRDPEFPREQPPAHEPPNLPPTQQPPVEQPPQARPPAGRGAARLTVTSLRRGRGALAVAGRVAPSATGIVTVVFTAKVAGRARSVSVRARVRGGKWAARVRLSSPLRARHGTVAVRYAGDRTTLPSGTLRRKVKPPR